MERKSVRFVCLKEVNLLNDGRFFLIGAPGQTSFLEKRGVVGEFEREDRGVEGGERNKGVSAGDTEEQGEEEKGEDGVVEKNDVTAQVG
eukprot:CAMPEP_0184644478 /NCGR_PEP_ID=MMETSP0308-20130426/1191_1 /TAXON_ID=38269 /ORGANISM="Gloeochaete witrockiana, Strain SAG 46.84" /LENGTH=88 /DNA_ID=CAMNT_0027073029 /DNA_START=157 /DNA_END=423 /DNA_ORIENTATION=-